MACMGWQLSAMHRAKLRGAWRQSPADTAYQSASVQKLVQESCRIMEYLKLEIVEVREISPDEVYVTFKFWIRRRDSTLVQVGEEESRFVREDRKWLYISQEVKGIHDATEADTQADDDAERHEPVASASV